MAEEAEKLETEKLVAAIHAGDASAIRGAGKSVAELVDGSTKKSALSLAAGLGNVEVVKALITEGAADSTAAGQAAFNGHIDVLTHLLEAGGAEAATATDPLSGLTPLMQAALKGHSPCVAKVLAAAPESLHATDALGRTALMLAAMSGNAETVRMLAEHGSKLNATSREGRTALMWAVIAHKYRAVEALALLGADPEVREVASSGLIKPGGEEAPKSVRLTPSRTKSNPQLAPTPGPPAHPPTAQAMDHASARSGKDPVLIFIRDYLIAWEKARHRAHHTHRTTLALPTTPDPPPQTHHPTAHHVPPPSPSRPARRASPRLQWRSRAG